MRTATITPEEIDVDVCVGQYDGFVTRTAWVVAFYENAENLAVGVYEDECCYKTEEYANAAKTKYEAGEFQRGEYGEIIFEF